MKPCGDAVQMESQIRNYLNAAFKQHKGNGHHCRGHGYTPQLLPCPSKRSGHMLSPALTRVPAVLTAQLRWWGGHPSISSVVLGEGPRGSCIGKGQRSASLLLRHEAQGLSSRPEVRGRARTVGQDWEHSYVNQL